MKTSAIVFLEGDIQRRVNVIPPSQITVVSTGPGSAALAKGAKVLLNWPMGLSLVTDHDGADMTDLELPMKEVCRIPRNVRIDVGLKELAEESSVTYSNDHEVHADEVIGSLFAVALAQDSSLTIYADFDNESGGKVTFELKSSLGEIYAMQSISMDHPDVVPALVLVHR